MHVKSSEMLSARSLASSFFSLPHPQAGSSATSAMYREVNCISAMQTYCSLAGNILINQEE